MKPDFSFKRFKTLIVSSGHIFRTVEITFKSVSAKTVAVIGDFATSHFPPLPMTRVAHGLWRIELRLTPGCYRYQFVVDGALMKDAQACSANPRRLGGTNCALRVE
jgi:1,4-alpha-glucan branching enzyme